MGTVPLVAKVLPTYRLGSLGWNAAAHRPFDPAGLVVLAADTIVFPPSRPGGTGWQAGRMTTHDARRSVTVERTASGRFTATNPRGGAITFGTGEGGEFSPTELLLAAIGGCTAVDVDLLTSRRAEPEGFEIVTSAAKVRDGGGNHLTGIEITYRVTFPGNERGDAARAILPDVVKKSHERLCTVGRTIELGTPIATRIEP